VRPASYFGAVSPVKVTLLPAVTTTRSLKLHRAERWPSASQLDDRQLAKQGHWVILHAQAMFIADLVARMGHSCRPGGLTEFSQGWQAQPMPPWRQTRTAKGEERPLRRGRWEE